MHEREADDRNAERHRQHVSKALEKVAEHALPVPRRRCTEKPGNDRVCGSRSVPPARA
jgi:hypothetical protein